MQGIKRKRRCESQCKQHIFSLKYLKTSSKYDIKMNFCPKYQRQPLPPEQTFAQFNNDRLYYTSAFVIGIDKKVVAKNLQKEMLDHQKLIKQCCEKYNPVIFPRPNSKHFLCSVCKQNYKNYYVHIFSPEHSYKVNENNYNDSIKQLCQKFRQLWEGAQQKADEQQERRKQQLQMELNDQEEGQYQQQQVEENFEEQNEENKLQNGYRQYSQQKQKQIVLKKIQSAVTSKPPKQIKQKDSNKRSSAPFLFQQIPKKKICLNDRNPSTSQSKKKQQVQNSQFNQQKLQKTVPNNQEAFISARGQQQQRLKQLLAGERSKDPRLQKFSQRSTRNQALGKKQTNQINYTQFYEKGQQRLKNQRIRMEQRQYNSRRFITEKQLFKLHQYNEMQNQKNRFNENQKKNNQRKPQKDKFYQGIDLVQSNSRNNPNDSNQDKRFQMDHYRSKQHHDAEDSKKSINQMSNRSRNAELSRKMSDNFKDKNLPFQNPYYKYQSYYSPHPAHIYGGYYPPYGAQLQKLDPYRKHSDRQNANSSQIRYDHRMYYPVWQPPPQYCMPPPVIVQRSNPPTQNGKSQQGYSSSYLMPQYQSNNFRQTEYVPHPYSNAHRQGPNTSININFPMYMAYPPNYYSSAQPPRYPPSLNQDNFTTGQQMGQPVYRNYQEQPYYYQQRNSYQQKKQYRQEKR